MKYTIQVAPEDCTGCSCAWKPARRRIKPTQPQSHQYGSTASSAGKRRRNWDFFLALRIPTGLYSTNHRQKLPAAEPLFEFSGACAGCGETPYIKL